MLSVGGNSLIVYYVLLVCTLHQSQALSCWECSHAASSDECRLTGKAVSCTGIQDVCSTVVRREKRRNTIWKRCKQSDACRSNELQNFINSNQPQCNNDQSSSVCTCCCETSMCNQNNMCQANNKCPIISSTFRNGEVSCSDGNNPGSVCEFTCTSDGFSIQPTSEAGTSRCLRNGQWSQPKRCCARPCPPFVPIDYVALVHANDETIWKIYEDNIANSILKTYHTGPDSTRMARVPFSGRVHIENAITFNSTSHDINSTGFFELVKKQKFSKTDDGIVNIGAALRYALNIFRNDIRLLSDHLDVVVVATDTMSSDDVLGPAQKLRELGVLTFAQFVRPTDTEQYNMTQLLEIAGDDSRILITNQDGSPLGSRPKHIQNYVCDDICRFYQ